MPSVFSRIINGELPARMVWNDERCVAVLSISPLRPGHSLVIPREEIDNWLEVEPDLLSHVMSVAQHLGRAIQRGFQPARVAMMIAGLEVPHVHVHLVPISDVHDLDFARQNRDPDPQEMDRAARTISWALDQISRA